MIKKNVLRFSLIALLGVAFSFETSAQDNNFNYSFESQFISSTSGQLPFWLHSNRFGTVDPQSTNFISNLSADGELYRTPNLVLQGRGEAVLRLSEQESIHLPKISISALSRGFQLDLGRFYHQMGLNNHELSMGSMMMSQNTIPLPRVMLSMPDYKNLPFTKGVVQYRGMFSHGWFNKNRYVDNVLLHQKYLYLKVNIGDFSGIGGIVHNAQWGGTSPDHGRLPQSFGDYFRVITGIGADEDSNAPGGEVSNVIGNSVAAYEFGAFYDFDGVDLSLTRLFYLEDGVSRRFRSPWDGVWGLNLKLDEEQAPVSAFTYEHINTKQQDAKPEQELGRASYYNHSIYQSGWTHHGRVLGVPLFTVNPESGRTIANNILIGHHAGVEGWLSESLRYKMMAAYSRNYGRGVGKAPRGTIDFDERRNDQFSLLVEGEYKIPAIDNLSANISLALDSGQLYENNIGFIIGFRWGKW